LSQPAVHFCVVAPANACAVANNKAALNKKFLFTLSSFEKTAGCIFLAAFPAPHGRSISINSFYG